ncbi:thioredoxin [Dendrosporobacter sp. 1207_IL3150]|uniref:thioredoxin n=1 Tax=Dendrosporobacter sp. 1207_IL3150 TaxID=3084054 RepID=UPI002FD93874
MANVISINEENFNDEVIDSSLPVLVDFWAPWCGYCTKLSPVFDDLAQELGQSIKLVKINVDDNRKLAEKHGVMSLPTILLFSDGEQVEKIVGFLPKAAIVAKIKPYI